MDFGKTMDNVAVMEKTMTKVERKGNKIKKDAIKAITSFKAILTAISIGLIISISMLLYAFYIISNWYAVHRVSFRQPVLVQNPVVIKKIEEPKKVEPKKLSEAELLATAEELKLRQKEALVDRYYQMTRFFETKVGFDKTPGATHIYCQSIGLVNEVGYFPDGNRKFCFDNEAEQKLTLTRWFTKRIDAGMDHAEMMCLYVEGIQTKDCVRAKQFGL